MLALAIAVGFALLLAAGVTLAVLLNRPAASPPAHSATVPAGRPAPTDDPLTSQQACRATPVPIPC
jgi:hypothetical protein